MRNATRLWNEKKWVSDASYVQKKATADEARGRVERATRALALAKNQVTYTDRGH